ncbi:MAG: hypothetical protein IJC06_03635 [Clostridia bacterium]|nr:hypothetical protein [Clostridia bacterium]
MKNLKIICNTLITAGGFLLIGTAGYSDNNFIEIADLVKRVIICFNLIFAGTAGKFAVRYAEKYVKRINMRYKRNVEAIMKMQNV